MEHNSKLTGMKSTWSSFVEGLRWSSNMVRLIQVLDTVDRPDLKFPAFVPKLPRELSRYPDIFEAIRRDDVLLHHPYQSFEPVLDFIRTTAADPNVIAIKQTVYRTGTDS